MLIIHPGAVELWKKREYQLREFQWAGDKDIFEPIFLLLDLSLKKSSPSPPAFRIWATAGLDQGKFMSSKGSSWMFWKSLSQPQSPPARAQSPGFAETLPFQDLRRWNERDVSYFLRWKGEKNVSAASMQEMLFSIIKCWMSKKCPTL